MNGWTKCGTHTQLGIYSALQKKDILPLGTTWLDLEGIALSETSQPQKTDSVQ